MLEQSGRTLSIADAETMVRRLLTPWESWKGVHADLLLDVCRQVGEPVDRDVLSLMLADPAEVASQYKACHPDANDMALFFAAHALRQKLDEPEMQHPRELLVRVTEVGTAADWLGTLLASPNPQFRAGTLVRSLVLFIPDDPRCAHQEEQTFLSQHAEVLFHTRSIRHSARSTLPMHQVGDLVRFNMPRPSAFRSSLVSL